MDISTEQSGSEITFSFNGRFDHHAQGDFTKNYEPALRDRRNKIIKLDMSRVEYVDYSALGLLLTLKEKAEAVNMEIVFGPCSKIAMKIFEATSFLKIFRFLPC
ncbi:MAG TPA: STAS domain-containing protein [Methylophilaceae bacterium]|jgi:anti-anti-sigma factor